MFFPSVFPKSLFPKEKGINTTYRHKYKGSIAITAHKNYYFNNATLKQNQVFLLCFPREAAGWKQVKTS